MKAGEMTADSFKLRSDLHVARKIWHALAVLVVIIGYHNLSRREGIIALSIAAGIFIAFDLLRQHIAPLNKVLVGIFNPFMRQHEINGTAGTTWLLAGVLIVALIFDKQIVKLTLFFLAVGDPVASYFGVRYGKDKIVGNKTFQGSLAAFAACFVIGLIFFVSEGIMIERLLVVSLLSGLIGALSELIPVGKLDDNFTFPIISSFMLYGLFHLFGAFT